MSDKHDHSHNHDQDHGHHHHHHSHGHSTMNEAGIRGLKKVILITLLFMFVEFAGGLYTRSLALTSDAFHMFTDVGALILSLVAFRLSQRPATDARTFGLYRIEILAAFINGILLVLISLGIIWSAWDRYQNPTPIKAVEMFWISTVGLVFNLVGARILIKSDPHHLNMRGALFHVLGDALGSLGAMVAALLVLYKGWLQADPIVSTFISFIIIASAARLLLDTTHVILEGAPHHLETDEIRNAISAQNEVIEVHDLHVWSITSGMVSLSVHVVSKGKDNHQLLCDLKKVLKEKFGIEHVTIQIESKSLRAVEPTI